MEAGFAGLGRMGANMARRLVVGGHRVVVGNRSPEPVEQLAALRGQFGGHPVPLMNETPAGTEKKGEA